MTLPTDRISHKRRKLSVGAHNTNPTSPDLIREALHFIPADDREVWVQMGMAIKSELGDDGFEIWNSWSQSASNYDPKAVADAWKSIKSYGGITIATLFHTAKVHGYTPLNKHKKTIVRNIKSSKRHAEPDKQQQVENERVASKAAQLWDSSGPANIDQAYLSKKKIPPTRIRQINEVLLIPMRDHTDKLWNLQQISPNGIKRPISGDPQTENGQPTTDSKGKPIFDKGRTAGCYFEIGDRTDTIYIAEGFATGTSIHQASNCMTVVAFSAYNLLPVAKTL